VSQQINLFNPAFRKPREYLKFRTMLRLLGLILFGSVLYFGFQVYMLQQIVNQADETDKSYASLQAKLVNYSNEFMLQKSSQNLGTELKSLEVQAAAQKELLNTIKSGEIGNTEGYSEYMRAFARQTVNGLWLTAFDITGSGYQLSISGGVLSPQLVPNYIQRLGNEKVLRGKTFATLQMHQPKLDSKIVASRGYVEFNLQSTEAGGAKK
jgi:cell division protein FtsB